MTTRPEMGRGRPRQAAPKTPKPIEVSTRLRHADCPCGCISGVDCITKSTPLERYRARLGLPLLPRRLHDGDVLYWSAVAMGWQDILDAYDELDADAAVLAWLSRAAS